MSIIVTIGGIDQGDYINRRSLKIREKLYSRANIAKFDFYCSDVADAPVNGSEIIITDDDTKIFAGRILTKKEKFLPPNNYKYHIKCIDYHRDLDRKLVNATYTDQKTGDIVKDIISNYCTGLTTTNVSDGVTISGSIVFDYMYPSDCIKQLAELSLYSWYIDYDKDVHFFTQAAPNAPFTIDDDQEYYKDLRFSYDFSQLRNKVRVRGAGSINVTRQNDTSIAAIAAIEGGDGIYEHIINDNTITTESLAQEIADADLDKYKDVDIIGEFLTDQTGVKAGQLIEVDSTKRNLTQNFMVQKVELEKITIGRRKTGISYKSAEEAVVSYAPAASATHDYETVIKIYYVYRVTIASKLVDLASLLLDMLHQQGNILSSKDTTPPSTPSGLTLSTGMGLTTQATLAWIKAEWSANSEADFSYYELRMKKSTDSDFTIVTTKNITFIWYSLEPGVTFNVYIRAIDTSGNASSWSSLVSKTTATDSDTPAQLSAPTITAILAGIKITWTAGTEDNISHYKIERQESDNDVDWSGWSTIANVDTTMWLDLLLTYTKYYRYRISTVTQVGNSGNPSDPSNSVQPNQAGENDIVANAITTNLLNVNEIMGNEAWFGKVKTDHLEAGEIVLATVAKDFDWSTLEDKPELPTDENLVGYWSLNDGTGTKAKDSSNNGNDGTLHNMEEADWVQGISGKCLSFDGVNEYIQLGSVISFADGVVWSLSFWAKPPASTSWDIIITSYGDNKLFMFHSSNAITFKSENDNYYNLGIGYDGEFRHYVIVCSGGKLYGYKDGVLIDDMTPDSTKVDFTRISQSALSFQGLMDEIRIYNVALTEQEVKALYENPSGLTTGTNPGADVTGDNTAADIINLPATPSGAGLYASGSYLGYHDGAAWKAYIQSNGLFYFSGDANNYIQWNGSSLAIKGSITLVNTIPNAKVDGLGGLALVDSLAYGDITGSKPPSNADVTLSAIQGELSLAGGGLVLASAGAKIRGGQTAYGVGTGFWLGDVSGTTKFSIGSSTAYLRWNGSALSVKSASALSNINVNMGSITAGNLTINSSGFIKSTGKDSYTDTTAGFWLGYSSGYKLNIGNNVNWLKWTGSALQIKGRLSVGLNTNEDILFEDSGIRMYDAVSSLKKQIYWKYGTVNFARLTYDTAATKETNLHLYAGAYNVFLGLKDTGVIGFITNGSQIVLGDGNATSSLMFWPGTKQLYLGVSVDAPTENNYAGQIIAKEGGADNLLHVYTSAGWRGIAATGGW